MLNISDEEFLQLFLKKDSQPQQTNAWHIRAKIGEVIEEKEMIGSFESVRYVIEVAHAGFSTGWLAKYRISASTKEWALSQAKQQAELVDRRWVLAPVEY